MSDHEQCPRIESLSALVDDELDATERVALEAHVAACASCARMLAEMRELHTGFAALATPARDFDVAAEVDRRIAALAPRQPSRASRPAQPRWWQVALLAPGGAAAVAVGLALGASIMPAAASAPAAQMAAFSALPPGAVCPVANACARPMK